MLAKIFVVHEPDNMNYKVRAELGHKNVYDGYNAKDMAFLSMDNSLQVLHLCSKEDYYNEM